MSDTDTPMPPLSSTPIYFGKFIITSEVFHLTPLSMAFVNLKPLLPGHILISPRRIIPRLSDLSTPELNDLFLTVQRVSNTISRVYSATALNIAMQDGEDAGQSVPHVHCHIIPRRRQDLEHRGGGDAIYGMLEGEEGDVGGFLGERERERGKAGGHGGKGVGGDEGRRERPKFPKVDEASRMPRSEEEMRSEAEGLRREMERDVEAGKEDEDGEKGRGGGAAL